MYQRRLRTDLTTKNIQRGNVYLIDLSKATGRLQKKRRVVVVQNDVGNRYSSETIVVPLRDLHGGRMLPIFVPVEAGVGGLTKDVIIDAGHINTVAADQLEGPIGSLPPEVMARVDAALRVSLSLNP